MSKTKTKFIPAFTLIELILTIAIIGILAAVVVTNIQSSVTKAKLQSDQREIAATIKQAQSSALQGKTIGSAVPAVFGFRFTNDTTYIIYHTVPANVIATYKLHPGVRLIGPAPVATGANTIVEFNVPHGEASGSGVGQTPTLQVSSGATKTIQINPGGSLIEN